MADQEADEPLDDHTPESTFERTLGEGRKRLGREPASLMATALVGGIDVATGVLALLLILHATGSKMLAGLGFSIGFIALTLARSEIFTENFLVPVMAVIARQSPLRRLPRLWVVSFVFSLLGGWIMTWFIMGGFPDLHRVAISVGTRYVDYGLGWRAFSLAVVAGTIITLMTWMQHATDSVGAKMVAAVVAGFLLGAGALNHTIVASIAMFAALHAGVAPFGYVAWLESALFAALGNMVGGIGLVTLLRVLQVPHRVAQHRADPGPEVAGR